MTILNTGTCFNVQHVAHNYHITVILSQLLFIIIVTITDDGLPYLTVTDFSNELPSVFNHSSLYQSSSHPINPSQPLNDK